MFPELEMLFQHFISGKKKRKKKHIQIALKGHKQLQITWRRLKAFQTGAHPNNFAWPEVKSFRL